MVENLYGKSRDELGVLLAPLTGRAFHARQLFGWLYARGASDFGAMSNLPRPLREALAARFTIRTPARERRECSADGTVKYRLRLEDGKAVESVTIPEARRITFCISSQVGCPLGCEFCLTAKMGLVRNLAPGEIAGQVALLAAEHDLSANDYNIVFMGMGEPLNNYEAVMGAFRLLTDPEGFAIAPRHITLSTAGVVPGIRRLAGELSRPRLAVSLSATTDELRDRLMPINRAYPLAVLFQAIREFPLPPRQRVTLEYVLLRGLNDSLEDAARLASLVGAARVKVNLIPYNEGAGEEFSPPPAAAARAFRDRLLDRGVPASLRKRRGADISAACGQLAILEPGGGHQSAPSGPEEES
jgi:23S rRNA (adenine2503-C2)-methyltransferase